LRKKIVNQAEVKTCLDMALKGEIAYLFPTKHSIVSGRLETRACFSRQSLRHFRLEITGPPV
jgi:hypothetical protein